MRALLSAQEIESAMLGGAHQPGPGIVRDAALPPLLERNQERVLREILGLRPAEIDTAGRVIRKFVVRRARPSGEGERRAG